MESVYVWRVCMYGECVCRVCIYVVCVCTRGVCVCICVHTQHIYKQHPSPYVHTGTSQVVIHGLTAGGYLLARDVVTGEAMELHPDGNR